MFKKQFKNIDFRLNAIAQALTELHNENKLLQSQNEVAKKYADDMEKMSEEFACRIDKAIEYITSEEYFSLNNQKTGSFCEDSNNYMKAHDKLLKILKGE